MHGGPGPPSTFGSRPMPAPRQVVPASAPLRARPAALLLLLLAACAPRPAAVVAAPPTPAPVAATTAAAPAPARAPAWAVVSPAEGAEHYVDQLLEAERGHVTRWERGVGDTIRVWAPAPPSIGAGRDPGATLARAVAMWNDVGLPVRFARVQDSASADVRVRWVRTDGEADVAGRARLRIAGGTDRIVSATVALATHMPSGYPFPESAALGHALHELGHVLGIQHTGRYDCVMFPIPQRDALCPADVETARRWYALPTGVVSAAGR